MHQAVRKSATYRQSSQPTCFTVMFCNIASLQTRESQRRHNKTGSAFARAVGIHTACHSGHCQPDFPLNFQRTHRRNFRRNSQRNATVNGTANGIVIGSIDGTVSGTVRGAERPKELSTELSTELSENQNWQRNCHRDYQWSCP